MLMKTTVISSPSLAGTSGITLDSLRVSYHGNVVLKPLSLTIEPGEVLALIGPSGSGKTTVLRAIAGFVQPAGGRILIGDTDVTHLPPYQRGLAMVVQNYALFPHMKVEDNVAFGLRAQKQPRGLIAERVTEALKIVGMADYATRYPHQLSGGQQQRVAIARTLAPEPTVLFMDEPLSNLDAKLRLEMRYELQRLHLETGSTFVYVTHDQMEAMTLATRICLIDNGVLQQYAPPLTVYGAPENLFVADFVGNPAINFINAHGEQSADGSIRIRLLNDVEAKFIANEALDLPAWFRARDEAAANEAAARAARAKQKGYVEKSNKDEVFHCHIAKVVEDDDALLEEPVLTDGDFVLGIRPEFVVITEDGNLPGEIYGAMPTGMESTLKIRVGEYLLTSVAFGSSLFAIGTAVKLAFTGNDILLFDRKSGRRIACGQMEIL